jgi:nitrogenase iron protein NifH
MLKIAIYGKGGIGKSTVTSNIAAAFAEMGKKVMQIGCDPKADSTMNLLGGKAPLPIMKYLEKYGKPQDIEEITEIGYKNAICYEVGGPTPGKGCAGRGIISAFELLDELGAYEKYSPDVVLYDVLGDVVCGGFAIPMRAPYARKVLIVTSGEKMALYAAENIINAINNFSNRNYAKLGGIILNKRNVPNENETVEKFAKKMNAEILETIPKDENVNKAEEEGKTVIQYDKNLEISEKFFNLAKKLLKESSC